MMLRTVTIGTTSAQGFVTRLLPGGYARVMASGKLYTGKLVAVPAKASAA